MALKPCKECKKEVSSTAKFCPHCGVKEPGIGFKERFLGGLVFVIIVIAIVVSCTGGDKEDKNPSSEPTSVSHDTTLVTKENLGITPEEFRKAYNSQIGKIDKSWRIAEFDIGEGDVNNAFNAPLGKVAHIVGGVDKKTGNLTDLMLVVGGGKPEENLQAVAAMLTVAQSATQGASKQEISKAVTSLMQTALDNIDNPKIKPATANIGNRTYTFSASQMTGLMFVISDAEKTTK